MQTHTYIAFDFGMKHIGVAVAQSNMETATALSSFPAQNGIPEWDAVLALLAEWDASACVVGIPLTADGDTQHITHCAKKFANRLHEKSRLPVHHADERYTSMEAERHIKRNQLKDNIHAYSAKLILESWLRNESSST